MTQPGPAPTLDFQALFESLPGLYLVLEADLTIAAVSDAYLKATLTQRERILGCKIFEVFPDNPGDPHATGAANLRESLARVVREHRTDTMAVQKYDVRRPSSAGGGVEERFWSPLNCPVLGPDGALAYIIHRVEDVTDFIRLKQQETLQQQRAEELQSQSDRMETDIFLRAQEVQEANKQLRVANEELARKEEELQTLDRLKSEFLARHPAASLRESEAKRG